MLVIDVVNGLLLPVLKWMAISVVIMTLVCRSRNTSAATLHALVVSAFYSIVLLMSAGLLLPKVTIDLPLQYFSILTADVTEIDNSVIGFVGVYFVGVIFLLVKMAFSLASIFNLGSRAKKWQIPSHVRLLAESVTELGVRRRVHLRYSMALKSPVTYGVLRPSVIMPIESGSWSEARVHRFLLHELAHIKRLDWLWKISTQTFCSLFWFVPTAWLLLKKMEWYSELASDDEVVSGRYEQADYAKDLLEMSLSIVRPPRGAIALMEVSEHYRRIATVLDSTKRRVGERAKSSLYIGLMGILAVIVTPFQFELSKEQNLVRTPYYFIGPLGVSPSGDESVQSIEFKGVDSVDGIEMQVMNRQELKALKTDLLPAKN